jgi:hypothetical protein
MVLRMTRIKVNSPFLLIFSAHSLSVLLFYQYINHFDVCLEF